MDPTPHPPRATSRSPGPRRSPPGARGAAAGGLSAPSALPLAAWEAFVALAEEAARRWNHPEHGAVGPAEVRAIALRLCDATRQALDGTVPQIGDLPPYAPARRILDDIRRIWVDTSGSTGVPPTETLRVVAALERVQDALDDDPAHRFASRLAGQDAQQLVVEMAHDMRSPIGSILILAERLRQVKNANLSAIHERQLGLIYSAAFGLSAMAGDVIELARGGTTLVEQRPHSFSITEVLQAILDILRPMAEEKQIAMRAAGPESDVRIGHQAALHRVLLNLATNALKFTNAGHVEISCRQIDRSRIEFSVTDTGRGIPPSVMSSLFETFRQRQVPGDYAFSSAGLGLSICKKLVAAMGGELGVETEPERGTRFHFELDLPPGSRY